MDTCYNMNKSQKQHARVHTRPWRTQMTVLGKSIATCGKGLLFPPQACQYGCLQKCRDLRAVVGVIFTLVGQVIWYTEANTWRLGFGLFQSWELPWLVQPTFPYLVSYPGHFCLHLTLLGAIFFRFVLLCFPWNLVSCYMTAASCVVNLVSAHTQAGFHFNGTAACWQKRPERCKAGLGLRQGRTRRPVAIGINCQAAPSSFWSNIEVPK